MSKQEEGIDAGGLFEVDPKRYRLANIPHETAEAATLAVQKFHDAVAELRVEHKIASVLLVYHIRALRSDGEEGETMMTDFMGDQLRQEALAAFAHGEAAKQRQEIISDLFAAKHVLRKPKR